MNIHITGSIPVNKLCGGHQFDPGIEHYIYKIIIINLLLFDTSNKSTDTYLYMSFIYVIYIRHLQRVLSVNHVFMITL